MNKLLTKVARLALGLSLAAGVGVAIGSKAAEKVDAVVTNYSTTLTSNNNAASWTNVGSTHFDVTLSNDGGSNDPKFNGSTDIRLYNKNYITVSAKSTYASSLAISAVTVIGKGSKSGNTQTLNYKADGTLVKSGESTITFPNTASQTHNITFSNVSSFNLYQSGANNVQITSLAITYSVTTAEATYSVIYDANATINVGGTLPSPHGGLSDNTTQSLSQTGPTRWGYSFSGWATTANGTTPVNSVTIDGDDITVYAIWTADLTVTGAHASVPLTVAEAKSHIDGGTNLDENYVAGKISQIDSYNSTYHSLQYWISDDGTTANQLQVYSGKGLNSADFSSTSDIQTGADVVICGTLKKFNSTYEFDKNNYQVSYSYTPPAVTHNVTFVANGGSNSPAVQTVGDGQTFVFPSAGTKANNIFKGWSSNNSTFYQEGDTSGAISADTTFTAYWQTEGTSSDPYSVAEAKAAIDANTGLAGAHVSGLVSQVSASINNDNTITYYISDDGTTTGHLEVYKGKGLNNTDFSDISDVEVGASVTVVGRLKLYNNTKYEFDSGNYLISYSAPVVVTLTSISISGSLTKTSYTTAEQWDPSGLTVTATYSDTSTADVTNSVSWGYSPLTPNAMGAGTDSLTITATYQGESDSTSKTVTVSAVSFTNTSGLVPGTYFIKYQSNYFTGTISSGKGSSSTTKPETTNAQFTFTLVGNDTWTVINGSSQYLTIGSGSTTLGLSASYSTLEVESGSVSDTYKIKGSSGRYVAWYADNSDFRTYSSGNLDMTLEDVNAVLYTITYSANGGSGDTMANSVGVSPVVSACSYTAPEGQMFSRWNTASDGSGDDYSAGDVATSDLDLYAIWVAEIGKNITMTPGTSASNVSVVTTTSVNKDAVKCGASSTAGSMTLTLKPSGITKIKVYVAGWNGDTNKGIDVSISSGTISPTSITVTGDSGISGSGSTFTLGAVESTYKFEFTISNAPANAVVTLTAQNASKNRFVVWGATDMFADTFADEFLTNLTCNANGASQPTYLSDYSWAGFANLYSALDEEEQGILSSAVSNESGTDIQKTVARYDYIVGKYNKGLGITSYNDFMNRNPAQIGGARVLLASTISQNTNTIAIIVIISMVSVTAIGGYFFIRRRKVQ